MKFLNTLNQIQKIYAEKGVYIPVVIDEPPMVATPSATCVENTVTMSCTTEDATIKYSTDGSTYTDYSAPITISETTTYSIYAVKEGNRDSKKIQFTAEYVAPEAPEAPEEQPENNE